MNFSKLEPRGGSSWAGIPEVLPWEVPMSPRPIWSSDSHRRCFQQGWRPSREAAEIPGMVLALGRAILSQQIPGDRGAGARFELPRTCR